MKTHFLKFADENAWRTAAKTAGLWSTEDVPADPEQGVAATTVENWSFYTHDHAVDVVGTIYNDDAVVDADGNVTQEPTAKPGWHVNAKFKSMPDVLKAAEITPATPARIFAGDSI